MYNYLTSATKKRVIKELKKILADHPKYAPDQNNVQAKYGFSERPSRGIIVNNASADRVRLSADNFIGHLHSFVMSTPFRNSPSTTLEWVTENQGLLEKYSAKRDIFPTAPGVYLLTVTRIPDEAREIPGQFTIDPILTVLTEPVIRFTNTNDQDAQLSRQNIYPNSVNLWLGGRSKLIRDVDYHLDEAEGFITFLKPCPTGVTVYADYRYQLPQAGPYPFFREQSDVTTLPGAVLAFGDRPQMGDQTALVVTDERTETAEIFGGKFEINFDLVIFAKDSEDREHMSDYVIGKFLALQNVLGFEGLELLDINPGGENEEVFNPETDEYYYESSVSLSIRVDWETWIPKPIVLDRAEFVSEEVEKTHGYLDGSVPDDLLRVVNNAGLTTIPISIAHVLTYERII